MKNAFIILIILFTSITSSAQDYKSLEKELLAIYEDDQSIRFKYIEATEKPGGSKKTIDSLAQIMLLKDSVNQIYVDKILNKYGWIGKDKISSKASHTLFLVIQHAGLEVQKKHLPSMREAVKTGNADKRNLALLEDRVALREGKMQVYGSQVGRDVQTSEWYVLPLEDPETVDERRSAVGLEPLAIYLKNWNMKWDVNEYLKRLPELKKLNGIK